MADAAADARVVPRAANTSVATNVATDARAATTNIRATGSATLDTRAPLRPTNVTVNYAQAAPSAPGPRLGSGGGGGGANVFTGGSGVAAESGLASRAGLNTGSTSKLVFVDGSTGAARPASVGRTGSAGNTSVGGGARAAAVDEGGGAAVGRASNNSSQSSGSVGRTEGTGSAVANETPVRFGFEKPPARENGAPSSAESSAFADRPANAKISPERVNKRLAEADRQALDDLELPSLTGRDAKFKPKSRFDDVESKDLKDRGPRVSEARETRIEVEDRLARLNPETREKVINHLKEIPADRAHVRDSDFAAILNSKNPAATIDRLKLASTGPAGRTQAISKLDIEIGKRTRQLKVTSITRETKLITAQERSALLIERTLIEYGETIRVRNIYSANTHNRYYDLQKGYEPHSLEDTFNVDIEVVGEGNFVVRGSYATETAWSAPDGGYYTFYRKKGYLDRDISRDVLASPADVTLPVSEQGISRFTSYEAKPGEQFSLGQNGPVRYNKEGQSITGSGGDGGSIELFCSRSPNCVKFENISDSVRTPTCRAGTPACDQIFKIQEDSRFAAVIEQPNPAAVLAEQRGKTQKIIRDMETEHDSLVAELAKPDFDLIQARSKHPELVSAFNLEREISVKTNRLRGGGLGPRKLDSDTKALYDLEVGTNRTIQDIELSIPGGDKKSGFTNVQKVTKQEQIRSGIAETISRSDGAYRLREVDTKIRDTQARLSTVRDVAERRKIATDLIRYSEERSDILLSYKRIEEAVKSKIGGIKYLDDTAKTALLDDALTRLKVVREPLAPFVARAEKAAPAVPPTSGVGARGPPQGPLRVLDDAPSYSNEIELLAKRDGVTARDFTEPQIESYSRDLRIPNRNMAADIEYKPIATKRDLDSVVAKALPDANIDTDRLRRMMSYRPQSGYLSGADFAEARKFTLAVQERGLANLERLPLSKFERETLNKVMDRAPLYGRQIDADIPKLGRLSTEAQVQSNAVAEAAAAAKKAEFDARVARAEARLKPREPTVSEQAPSYINEIELLAKRDGVSALNVTERQIDAYAADLRITNRNMAGAIEYKPIATKRDLDATIAKALPDAGIDTDRLRRMMSYRPQSGYLSGADFAEARKFVQAVDARGVSTLDRLPLSKFERETLNRVIDRAPMYARQIDVDVPKLGRLSTEAQVTTDVAGDAARAAAKADFDARVARAETALNRSTANAVVPEKAPSYANEIEVLAKRDGVSAVNLNERQIQGYADDLRITNRNMAGAMEYKPVVTRRDMQSMIEKVVPEGIKVDAERLRRMMSYRPQSGYLNGADFAEAKKFMQAVEARGGPVALDQLPFTQFERQNLNKIMDRAPMYARQGDPLLPAKMGRLNPDPAAVVMPAQRAERFVADFEANGLNPKAATALTDADRIAVTERITGRKLKPAESDAVIKAHNIDCGGFSVNNPCNSSKAIALRRAGFSPNETRDIMRMGVTGTQKAVPPIRVLTAAEKAAGKDKLIEEFGNVKITTPEQNAAFIKFVKTSTPDQVDRAFLVMDNTKLGEINNVTSNKLLANAVTNKQIARVQEAMSDLAASYRPTKIKFISATDDVKAVAVTPYSSFKSGAYGFVTETGEKLPDEFLNLVSNRMVTVNNEYYTYLRELDVLPPTIDPMFMFRSGLDRTYRDAEQAARQARTMSDINRPRSMMEAQIREQAETSFAFSQLAQKIHTNRLQGTDLVIKDIQSGNWVLSTKGLDLIKKAKSPDVLVSQIKQTTGVVVTEKQATLLFKHKADTDTYIPSTLVVNRESPVLDSIHGGINFDLVGAGAEGSFRSQLAVARSKNVDELFVNSEKGERAVTEILNDRRAAVRAATEPVMEKYGVKGRFVESGDDMAFVAENKPVPQAALDEVVRNLGKTKEPSKVRMSAVEGGIKTVETRMTIGTQGEAIEKSVRARLVGVLPKELEEKLFIGVKMETRELGTGSARLMIGSDVPITPFQRQQIERAFNQAAVEYKYKAVISPAPAVVDAGAASVLKNADEFISSYRSNGLDPAAATALTDADRIAVTERITGRKLKPAESDAVIKAHNIDCGGFSVNNPCNSSKAIALRRAGFSPEETKDIMQMGVAGRESTTVGSTVQDFRGRRDWTVAGEPPTNRAAGTATTVVDPQRRPAQFGTATTRENPADLWVRINEDFQNQAKALDMTLIPENRGAPNKLTPSNTLTSPVQPLTPATPLDTALATGKVVRERPLGLGGINDGKKIVQLEGGSYGVWKPHEEVWYSSYRSEVLAYEVDKKLGFNLVPPTVTRLIDGKVGSLQLWAPSSKTATATQTALDKQSTLDFLIDHGDRHGGNYLVRDDRSIISIDNGIAFNGNGMNVRTLKERLPEILRFAKTTEGKAIIERVRALQNDTRFRSQIESYIGAKDAQRMMDRIGFLLRAAKEASGGK